MNGSAFDLTTPRGTALQMQVAVRLLDAMGATQALRVLSSAEIAGLEENARRVARKYWTTKGQRNPQSVQNQLDRPRWHYIGQAGYAKDVLVEMATDAGMTLAFYP
jgi:hypothetical protein